jgi:hypothetical protein
MNRILADRVIAQHPAIGTEPRDAYRFGQHPHRLRLKGIAMEARVYCKALCRGQQPKKFLIFGRPRSGTTLLRHLLGQVPDVICDGELMHDRILSPDLLARALPRRAGVGCYGFKLLSYQMTEVQKIRRPFAFMENLQEQGYKVIHLTRQTGPQTLSLVTAQTAGRYFNAGNQMTTEIKLDPDRVLAQIQWNERMLQFERDLMGYIDHLPVVYERDLMDQTQHQAITDRICAVLGHPSDSVQAQMTRTGGAKGTMLIRNKDQILTHLNRNGAGEFAEQIA